MNATIDTHDTPTSPPILSAHVCPKCTCTDVERPTEPTEPTEHDFDQWLRCRGCGHTWIDVNPAALARPTDADPLIEVYMKSIQGFETVKGRWCQGLLEGHDLANCFPMFDPDSFDYRELEESIREQGYDPNDPIVLWTDGKRALGPTTKIIDGRNRSVVSHKVWTQTQDERHMPTFVLFLGTELEAALYVRRRGFGRRNMTPLQLVVGAQQLFARMRDLGIEQRGLRISQAHAAKKLPPTGGETRGEEQGSFWQDVLDHDASGAKREKHSPTAKEVAELTGASPRTVERVAGIVRRGPDAVGQERTQQLIEGMKLPKTDPRHISATAAEEEVREGERKKQAEQVREQQRAEMAKAKEAEEKDDDASPHAWIGKLAWSGAGVELFAGDGPGAMKGLEGEIGTLILHADPSRPAFNTPEHASWTRDWDAIVGAASRCLSPKADIWIVADGSSITGAVPGASQLWELVGMWCLPALDARKSAGSNDAILLWFTTHRKRRRQADAFDEALAELVGHGVAGRDGQIPAQIAEAMLAGTEGLILDPCCGTGGFGVAALGLGRKAILVDLLDEQVEAAKLRLLRHGAGDAQPDEGQGHLFDATALADTQPIADTDASAAGVRLADVQASVDYYVSRRASHATQCVRCGAKQNKTHKSETCIACGYELRKLLGDDIATLAARNIDVLDTCANMNAAMAELERMVGSDEGPPKKGPWLPNLDDHASMLELIAMGVLLLSRMSDGGRHTILDHAAHVVAASVTALYGALYDTNYFQSATPPNDEIYNGVKYLERAFGQKGIDCRDAHVWYTEAYERPGTVEGELDVDLLGRQGAVKQAANEILDAIALKGKTKTKVLALCEGKRWIDLRTALEIERRYMARPWVIEGMHEAMASAVERLPLAPEQADETMALAIEQSIDLDAAYERIRGARSAGAVKPGSNAEGNQAIPSPKEVKPRRGKAAATPGPIVAEAPTPKKSARGKKPAKNNPHTPARGKKSKAGKKTPAKKATAKKKKKSAAKPAKTGRKR